MATDEPKPPSKRRRRLQLALALVFLGLVIGLAIFLNSARFNSYVRSRVVAQLENATGGRVELKSFHWNLSKLAFEADDLTIHGLEAAGEVPYAHVDRLSARAKILSFFGGEIGLRSLVLTHPVVHIVVYPDGSTNQPKPRANARSSSSVQQLFQLQVDHAELHDGLLLWNDRKIPLNAAADQLTAALDYVSADPKYNAKFQAGKIAVSYEHSPELLSQMEVEATLLKDKIVVDAMHWSSARSKIEASGQMVSFDDPHFDLAYRASLDLREVALLLHRNELRSGTIDLNGRGAFTSPTDFSTQGKAQLHRADWTALSVRLGAFDGAADYSLNADLLTLKNIAARPLNGSIAGDLQIAHWAADSGSREKQRGTAHLKLRDIDVQSFASTVSSRDLPLDKLHLASSATGSLDAQWVGSPADAEAQVVLDLTPPAQPRTDQLPLAGVIRASFGAASEHVNIEQLNLATRSTRMSAVGSLGATKKTASELRVSINTTDLAELEPTILVLGGGTRSLPLTLHGAASFNGTLTGKPTALSAIGHVEATDFETIVPTMQTSAAANTAPHQLEWDRFVADVNYSPTALALRNARLTRGNTTVYLEGSAGLVNGGLPNDPSLAVHALIQNADLAELQSLAGYNYPVSGRVNAQLNAGGTLKNLNGSGHVSVLGGTIYGEPYHSFSSDVALAGRQLNGTNVDFRENGAVVTGRGSFNFDSQAFTFSFAGHDFNFAHIARLQSAKLRVGGLGEFTAEGSGDGDNPVINANIRVRGMTFNGEAGGDLVLTAVSKGDNLHLAAHTTMEVATLGLSGDIRLRDEFPGDVHIHLDHLDFDPILRVSVPGRLTGHSSISGDIVVSGPFKQPRLLNVTADLPELYASVENFQVRNSGPIRFTIHDQLAKIDQLRLVGDGTDFTAGGSVLLSGARSLNLTATGQVNLKLLQTMNPDVVSYGMSTFDIHAGGNFNQPQLTGNVKFSNAGLSVIDLPNGLSEINGTLVFNQNRLQVEQLTARTGGGTLQLGGFIAYRQNLFFNVTATGRDIRIRYPEGITSQANADLRFTGRITSPLLSGDVTLLRFGVTPRFDLALYLARSKQTPAAAPADSLINRIRLDVHVVSTPELQVETSLAKLAGDVDLHLRGTMARPSVLGRVNIAEGDILFNATKYHLERGDITFTNPVTIDPVVNIEASATVRDYDITLGFHGSPGKGISTTYRSEPPLPSADIIALLALGRTQEESAALQDSAQQASFTQTASNAILGQALNAAVSSRIQKLFGVSKIKIDPGIGGAENRGASLTIEQQISNKVTLTYITNLQQNSQQVIQVEYNVNRDVSIVAIRDQTGVFGLDVRIRQRKR